MPQDLRSAFLASALIGGLAHAAAAQPDREDDRAPTAPGARVVSDTKMDTPRARDPVWTPIDLDLEALHTLLADQPPTVHPERPVGSGGVTFFCQVHGEQIIVVHEERTLTLRRARAEGALRFHTDDYASDESGEIVAGASMTIHANERGALLLTLATPEEPGVRLVMTPYGAFLVAEKRCRCVVSESEHHRGCSLRNCELYARCSQPELGTGFCDYVLARGVEEHELPLDDPAGP